MEHFPRYFFLNAPHPYVVLLICNFSCHHYRLLLLLTLLHCKYSAPSVINQINNHHASLYYYQLRPISLVMSFYNYHWQLQYKLIITSTHLYIYYYVCVHKNIYIHTYMYKRNIRICIKKKKTTLFFIFFILFRF